MRALRFILLLLVACRGESTGSADASAGGDANPPDATADANPSAPDASTPDALSYACDFADPRPPPLSILWPAELSATGSATLGGHSHDDSFGAVGYCPGTPQSGAPFFRLVAAGFETDTDITGDSDQNDALDVAFWRNAQTFTGLGESSGRINIYVEIVDEQDAVLNVNTNPEIRVRRTVLNGPVELFSLTSKPSNEFQTNFPMTGGGTRYAITIDGASDQVINMRLPVNHHVTYVLVYRRVSP